jgi:septum formation protein
MTQIKNQKSAAVKIKKTLILASASPRRAELLRAAGIPFQVVVSPAEEPEQKPPGIPTDLWPICLAWMKAKAVQNHLPRHSRDNLILAADTIVVDNSSHEKILNKAKNRAHARRMLLSLQGKTHRVITGIALIRSDHIRLSSAEATCRIRKVSPKWLDAYLDSGLWKGKAGAYGIQDRNDPFVHLVSGEFSTVVGLPMALLQSELATFKRK